MTPVQLAALVMYPEDLKEPLNEQQMEAFINVQKLDKVPTQNNPTGVGHEGAPAVQGNQSQQEQFIGFTSSVAPTQHGSEISQEHSVTYHPTDSQGNVTSNSSSPVEGVNGNIQEIRVAIADAKLPTYQTNIPCEFHLRIQDHLSCHTF